MSHYLKSGIIITAALLTLNCYAATPLGMPASAIHPNIQSPTINNPGGRTAGQAQANYYHNHGHNNGNNQYHNHNGNYYHSYNHHYPQNNVVVYPFVYGVVNDADNYVEVTPTPLPQDQPPGQPLPSRQTPDGVWVNSVNGNVPPNAIAEQDSEEENNNANNVSYYCRAIYNEQIFYGELVPGDGCYVEDSAHQATIRLKDYQALVGN